MWKILTGNRGMTLVEIVVAIAILVILGVSMIPLFGFGLSTTVNSGNRSVAVYSGAKSLESNINGTTDSTTVVTTKTLSIVIGSTTIQVPGKLMTASVTYGNNSTIAKLSTFVAD